MARLRLLGELRLEIDGQPVALPSSRKARLLLAVLALEPRRHGRSELAGRLWPDVLEESARASLRNALAQLRSALGRHADAVVSVDADQVGLADGVRTDVAEIETEPELALEAAGQTLLAGLDDDLVQEHRARLATRLGEVLTGAATAAEGAGDLAAAIRLSRRIVEFDPLAETAHRDLIRRLAADGDRAAALSAYERFRERLAGELRIVPSPQTRALVDGIRTAPGTVTPAAGPSRVRYARNGDRAIAYQRFGSGTVPLVIVPGWASNLDAVWDFPPLGPLYARLGTFADCVVFDKRGTGLSERDLDFGSLEERADDIRAVLDAAGIERAALFAYSESAALAMLFAAAHPERVSALALYSAYARLQAAPDYPAGFPPGVVDAFVERIAADWGRGTISLASFQEVPHTGAAGDLLARWERSLCTPTMAAQIIRRNADIDIRALLPALRARTLVLQSSGDPISPAALGRYVADNVPGARYVEHDASYHLPWSGGDAWFLDAVEAFVTGHRDLETGAEGVLLAVLCAADLSTAPHWGGRVAGDVALFESPSRAVRCAAELGDAGLSVGEITVRQGEPAGPAVDVARRLAGHGQVRVSRPVRDVTAGEELRYEAIDEDAFALTLR
jgi:DNA-binding SARP family transcriptional activator/pimeloyl-ACP methyl ester carboxylesterase